MRLSAANSLFVVLMATRGVVAPNLTNSSLYTLNTAAVSLSLWLNAGVGKVDRWVKNTMTKFFNMVKGIHQHSSSRVVLICKEMWQWQAETRG